MHPTRGEGGEVWGVAPHHELSLMCDDLDATVAELRAKGVEVADEVKDQSYGRVTSIEVPGAGTMQLYQPRYAPAYELDG